MNGPGTLTSDAGTYVGEFKHNKIHGLGSYTLPNMAVYLGYFENNYAIGKGSLIDINGQKLSGLFDSEFSLNGQGMAEYPSGSSYAGQFKNNQRDGLGTYTYEDGSRYSGKWEMGKKNGQGTYASVDGTVTEGIWKKGKFQFENIQNPAELLSSLFGGGNKEGNNETQELFGNLMKTVCGKLDNKFKSGDIKQDDLFKEAQEMMGGLNLFDPKMLSKMMQGGMPGMPGSAGGQDMRAQKMKRKLNKKFKEKNNNKD